MFKLNTNIIVGDRTLHAGSTLSMAELAGVDVESHVASGNLERIDVFSPDKASAAKGKIKDLEQLATSLRKDCDAKDEAIARLETANSAMTAEVDQLRGKVLAQTRRELLDPDWDGSFGDGPAKKQEAEAAPRELRERELTAKSVKKDDLVKIAEAAGLTVSGGDTKESLTQAILASEFPE